MTSDIAPLASIQDTIKDRIKAEFSNLIPDEVWRKLVTKVVDEFLNDSTDRYGAKTEAPIKVMIRAELTSLAKAQLKSELDNMCRNTWDGTGKKVASEAIQALVKEHFDDLNKAIQMSLVTGAVSQAAYELRNSLSRAGV